MLMKFLFDKKEASQIYEAVVAAANGLNHWRNEIPLILFISGRSINNTGFFMVQIYVKENEELTLPGPCSHENDGEIHFTPVFISFSYFRPRAVS